MDLVVDANILFSVLIKSGKTEELLFEEDWHLFAPEFIFEEFEKYKKEILEKAHRTEDEFESIFAVIKTRVKIIPNEETEKYLSEAKKISPDEKDVDYLALSLKLRCPLWSNDKKLKKQTKVIVYSTEELINM